MKTPSGFSRLFIILFVLTAFSAYYLLYFYSFHQGTFSNSGFGIKVVKAVSCAFLLGGFMSTRIALNYFDFLFLFLFSVLSLSYFVAGLAFGFHDTLFINFLVFCLFYLLFISKDGNRKVLYSYEVICVLIVVQILVDIVLGLNDIALWEGGLFVGGLGNPTSFGLVCNFCLAYTLAAPNGFSRSIKAVFVTAYVFAVIQTSALFPILLTILTIFVYLLNIRGLQRRFVILFLLLLTVSALVFIARSGEGLLGNKINALLYFLGFADHEARSVSIHQRLENIELLREYIYRGGAGLLFGHFDDISYYPVDSQYISIILSFGLFGFLVFIVFNSVAIARASLRHSQYKMFVLLVVGMFLLIFSNNRVLDYFPLGYLYVSSMALISKRTVVETYRFRRSLQY